MAMTGVSGVHRGYFQRRIAYRLRGTGHLRHTQLIHIAEAGRFAVFPRRIEQGDVEVWRRNLFPSDLQASIPEVENFEAFANLVCAAYSSDEELAGAIYDLLSERVMPIFSSELPPDFLDSVASASKSEILAIRGVSQAKELFYLEDAQLYVLLDEVAASRAENDRFSFISTDNGEGNICVRTYASARMLLDAIQSSESADEATAADGARRAQVFGPLVLDQGGTHLSSFARGSLLPLPLTSVTDGQEGEYEIGFAHGLSVRGASKGDEELNGDGFLISRDGLLIVADGMGSYPLEHVASGIAIQAAYTTLVNRAEIDVSEADAVLNAHQRVQQYAAEDRDRELMATSLSVVRIVSDQARVAHVGRSRVYHASQDEVSLLTKDQTQAMMFFDNQLAKDGSELEFPVRGYEDISTVDQGLAQKRGKKSLASAVGHDGVDIKTYRQELAEGDLLLLCSGTLSDELGNEIARRMLGWARQLTQDRPFSEIVDDLRGLQGEWASDLTFVLYHHEPVARVFSGLASLDKTVIMRALEDIYGAEIDFKLADNILLRQSLTSLIEQYRDSDAELVDDAEMAFDFLVSLEEFSKD